MNVYEFQLYLSLSIIFPVIACIYRIKSISPVYYPFVILIFLGFINETINYFFFLDNNAVSMNIYYIIEFNLCCWQFKKWKNVLNSKFYFYGLTGLITAYWIIDELFLARLATFTSSFLIAYPFALVLLAVNQLNFLIVNERGNILKNSIFLFCAAIIISYPYRVLSEIFYHYSINTTQKLNSFNIQAVLNVVLNILFTASIIYAPKKKSNIRKANHI